jgi:hypothetical protein
LLYKYYMATNPATHNALIVNYFQFVLTRVPNMTYFCQSANLPGLAFGSAEQPTILGLPVKVPTGAFRFEDLDLTFRVDENLTNWREIHTWIKTTGNYESDENTLPYSQKTSDARLLITNSSYRPKIAVQFKHVFPISLSGLNFNTTATDSLEMTASVKFAFTGYEIETLSNP